MDDASHYTFRMNSLARDVCDTWYRDGNAFRSFAISRILCGAVGRTDNNGESHFSRDPNSAEVGPFAVDAIISHPFLPKRCTVSPSITPNSPRLQLKGRSDQLG